MKSSYSNWESSTKRKQKIKKVIIWSVLILLVASIITLIVLDANCPKRQYLSKAIVSEAQILETYVDQEATPAKDYVKISLVNPPDTTVTLNENESWIEVNSDYYLRHKVGDKIGVLVGNYDIYKENNFGIIENSGQTFEKNIWGIEDILDSVDLAKQAYPSKAFNANTQLKSKTITNGKFFFVLTYEDREITVEVSNDQFNKYKETDQIDCSFEGVGEFIKITNVN